MKEQLIENKSLALVGVAQWIESAGLQTKGSPVRFPVRTHAWVVGQVPSRGRARGNHTLTFLSLSFSFPSPLSTNKINKTLKKKKKELSPWLVWLSRLSTGLWTEMSLVGFLVRAHAWVAGQVPNWGRARGNWSTCHSHINVSLSLSPSLPLSLKINK